MNGKQIRDIKAEGLTYVDDEGNEKFIDFAVCLDNYFRKVTSAQYIERMKELNPQSQWDEEGIKNYIASRRRWREIANRCVLGKPWSDGPFVEFHTEPSIRFDFDTEEEYGHARSHIERFGWKTFDLS